MKDKTTRITDFTCGDCGGSAWELAIINKPEGNTSLFVTCANKECVERKKKDKQMDETQILFWDEFDITGQGYDREDMERNTEDEDFLMN